MSISSNASVYELLSKSEKIKNGSISIDWSKLPQDLHKFKESTKSSLKAEEKDKIYNFHNCHFTYMQQEDTPDLQLSHVLDGIKQYHFEERIPPVPHNQEMSINELSEPSKFNASLHFSDKNEYSLLNDAKSEHKSINILPREPLEHKSTNILPRESLLNDSFSKSSNKQLLSSVHRELSSLSHELQDKNKTLKIKEAKMESDRIELEKLQKELDNREKMLKRREKQLKNDVDTMVSEAIKQREQMIMQDTDLIIKKYEESLGEISRENKRTQQSLKEMVQTNRLLREQNKTLSIQLDEKEKQIHDVNLHLKTERERNERLKSTLASTKKTVQKDDRVELFSQMKKMLNKQTRNIQCQTETLEATLNLPISKLLYSLLLIRQKAGPVSNAKVVYDSLMSTFDMVDEFCEGSAYQQKLFELYIELMYSVLLDSTFTDKEKYDLASLVYISMCNGKNGLAAKKRNITSRCLVYLIVLYGISQADIIIVILERIAMEINEMVLPLLEYHGYRILINLLQFALEPVVAKCSNILLTLISHGNNH